jgi:hypothetical protein
MRRRDFIAVCGAAMTFGEIATAAYAQSVAKTFVLVHGAYSGGWIWRRVSDLLEKKGHKVFTPTLTGLGERSHLLSKEINLDTHIIDIVNVFKWEDISDACLVAHSYGGFPSSGAIEQIADRLSSIVWVDAMKPENGQRGIDIVNGSAASVLAAVEKGEAATPVPRMTESLVNRKDSAWLETKLTPDPIGTKVQPIQLTGAREKIAKKTYIRATRNPSPIFDKALAECKADKSWRTFETPSSHTVMLDIPEWLTEILLQES